MSMPASWLSDTFGCVGAGASAEVGGGGLFGLSFGNTLRAQSYQNEKLWTFARSCGTLGVAGSSRAW